MLRQKINSREAALLKLFSWIERIVDHLGMAQDNFAVPQLGTRRPGAKIVDLVEHFRFGILRRLNQCLVEFSKGLANRFHGILNRPSGLLEGILKIRWKFAGADGFSQHFRTLEYLWNRQTVFIK